MNIGLQDKKSATKPQRIPYSGARHVLLRVRSENGETIAAHRRVIAAKGSVLFGKAGKPIGPNFRETINQQIEKGLNTFLFLTTREGWNGPYVTYRCFLRGVTSTVGAGKGKLIPDYYAFEADNIGTWFEITSIERLTREEMDRIFVLASGRSIMSSIKSSAAVFAVGISARRVM